MAPQTPPPGASIVLAALTMASTSSLVMSPSTISMRSGMTLLETPDGVGSSPLLRRRGGLCRGRYGRRVHRADPGDDLPQVVVALHHAAHGRHRPNNVLGALAAIALLLQPVAAERDQAKQSVVVLAVDPDLVGQGRAHATTAATAVTAIAAGAHEFLVTLIGHLGEVLIGAGELALGSIGC